MAIGSFLKNAGKNYLKSLGGPAGSIARNKFPNKKKKFNQSLLSKNSSDKSYRPKPITF